MRRIRDQFNHGSRWCRLGVESVLRPHGFSVALWSLMPCGVRLAFLLAALSVVHGSLAGARADEERSFSAGLRGSEPFFPRDGRHLLLCGEDGSFHGVELHDASRPRSMRRLEMVRFPKSIAGPTVISGDRGWLAWLFGLFGPTDGVAKYGVHVFRVDTHGESVECAAPVWTLHPPQGGPADHWPMQVSLSFDGRIMAMLHGNPRDEQMQLDLHVLKAGWKTRAALWKICLSGERFGSRWEATGCLSPDGDLLAVPERHSPSELARNGSFPSNDVRVRFLRTDNGRFVDFVGMLPDVSPTTLEFSPDGKSLLTGWNRGDTGRQYRLWHVEEVLEQRAWGRPLNQPR
jgi:hypothetical protein